MTPPRIGVLALQGDVREHLRALHAADARARLVRHADELEDLDGIVIPGGESTTIGMLADRFGVLEPLRERVAAGLPAYGSCAGMILLADRLVDRRDGQAQIGGLDVTVRRNAFGRQSDSFEADVVFAGEPLHAVFIRAPWVEQAGPRVEVLARAAGRIVAVRQGYLLATAFHPELSGEGRVHAVFVGMVAQKMSMQKLSTEKMKDCCR